MTDDRLNDREGRTARREEPGVDMATPSVIAATREEGTDVDGFSSCQSENHWSVYPLTLAADRAKLPLTSNVQFDSNM